MERSTNTIVMFAVHVGMWRETLFTGISITALRIQKIFCKGGELNLGKCKFCNGYGQIEIQEYQKALTGWNMTQTEELMLPVRLDCPRCNGSGKKEDFRR